MQTLLSDIRPRAGAPAVGPAPGPLLLGPGAQIGRAVLQTSALALLDLIAPAQVRGREWLDGLAGPALFVANHSSHLDTLAVLGALPGRWRRQIAVAAAADYFFARPVLGTAVALLCNAFPFARTGSARPGLEQCARLAAAGWSVLLYPEGTRAPDGVLRAFRPGAGLLAVKLGVPVVPIYLDGLDRVLPKGGRIPRPGRVRITFGAPLHFAPATPYSEAAGAIEAAVRTLASAAANEQAKGASHGGDLRH